MDHDAWNGKAADSQAAQDQSEQDSAETSSTCVLLVEDEALIAEIIGESLEEHGFCVHCVADAAEALAYLSTGPRIDILFTDINLPGDLDGVSLAEQVRGMLPDLPVIYASGRWGLLEGLRKLPLSMILQKPYSPARACAAIEMMMSKRTAALEGEHVRQTVLAAS